MMTGKYRSRDDLAEDDGRRWFPRYSEEVRFSTVELEHERGQLTVPTIRANLL